MATIIVPRRREDFFNDRGDPTQRFVTWMELVTESNNDIVTNIINADKVAPFGPQIQQILKELAGLPEFTMDTTGFTMDTTEFTMDKVLA
jgi:c-di-AMP phosphodiesterase-like protein